MDGSGCHAADRLRHHPLWSGDLIHSASGPRHQRADGKVVGLVTMIAKNHEKGELGYAFGIDFRGQGYATEAARAITGYCFSHLRFHRIQAIVSSANPESMDVLTRLGMKQEGRLREATSNDGKRYDLLYYGILKVEWQAQ